MWTATGRLFSAGQHAIVTEWDLATLQAKVRVLPPPPVLCFLALDARGSDAASPPAAAAAVGFHARARAQAHADSFGGPVWAMACDRAGERLAIGCEDGCVRLYDLSDGGLTYLRSFEPQRGPRPRAASSSVCVGRHSPCRRRMCGNGVYVCVCVCRARQDAFSPLRGTTPRPSWPQACPTATSACSTQSRVRMARWPYERDAHGGCRAALLTRRRARPALRARGAGSGRARSRAHHPPHDLSDHGQGHGACVGRRVSGVRGRARLCSKAAPWCFRAHPRHRGCALPLFRVSPAVGTGDRMRICWPAATRAARCACGTRRWVPFSRRSARTTLPC